MFAAAAADADECISLLCNAGAVVDSANTHGVTPLQIAAVKNNERSLHLLLSLGADVALADDAGNTALHKAARSDAAGAIDALLAHVGGGYKAASSAGGEGGSHNGARHAGARTAHAPAQRWWRRPRLPPPREPRRAHARRDGDARRRAGCRVSADEGGARRGAARSRGRVRSRRSSASPSARGARRPRACAEGCAEAVRGCLAS